MWGAVAAQDLSRMFDLPYVITEHSSAFLRNRVDEWQKPYIRKSFDGAEIVWAVSNSFKRSLQPFAGEANIDVMPNMVDVSFFHLPPCPRESTPFTFLSIGSLTPNKGIDLLLRAFARVVRTNEEVEMEIGGAGPEHDHLRGLALNLGVQDHIRFLGRLSREEVRRAMWRANAFVSSSYVETFGVVLIEAMATGLPVAATHSGGPSDIVHDGVGHLVPTGDVEALSKAMNQTIIDSIDENEIRNYVRNRYSAEVVTRRLKLSYRTITGAIRS
jgi:glycosyltransferase involved in cell wall biosynthesis